MTQIIKQIKNLYKWVIKDEKSLFYAADCANIKLINRAKNKNKDKMFVKLYKESENIEEMYFNENNQPTLPLATPFCTEKKEILIVQSCIVLRVPLNCYMQIFPT